MVTSQTSDEFDSADSFTRTCTHHDPLICLCKYRQTGIYWWDAIVRKRRDSFASLDRVFEQGFSVLPDGATRRDMLC